MTLRSLRQPLRPKTSFMILFIIPNRVGVLQMRPTSSWRCSNMLCVYPVLSKDCWKKETVDGKCRCWDHWGWLWDTPDGRRKPIFETQDTTLMISSWDKSSRCSAGKAYFFLKAFFFHSLVGVLPMSDATYAWIPKLGWLWWPLRPKSPFMIGSMRTKLLSVRSIRPTPSCSRCFLSPKADEWDWLRLWTSGQDAVITVDAFDIQDSTFWTYCFNSLCIINIAKFLTWIAS